ncbi:MAG: phosphoribosyltransferase family protein [Nitriliruptorales bacterium]|nr:phosphoribosyltransferase family protein [Nitriliruptorales bacterium]
MASTTALYRYRGVVADTVVASKLRGASAVWPALGVRLAEQLPRHARTVDAVTAVPTEPRRRKHRGFDHAWLFARGVAAQLHIPAVATLEARRGARDQGAIASIDERQQLPPGTFEASRSLAGARLLLVDDVLTTGATFTAAVSALAEAGATAVHLAALARAGAHPLDGRGHRGDDHESGPSHRVPR